MTFCFCMPTKIQKYGITQEQLDIAKSIIERDTYYSRESISSIASQIGYATDETENYMPYAIDMAHKF